MADDHARRTISAYGHDINHTPNIDRIAEEGAIFRNCFCGNSICGPSRASILTGKHSHKHGVVGNAKDWDSTQMVFPRIMKHAGYETALIGKWHLNSKPADEFDYYNILTGAGKQGFYYNPDFYNPEKGTKMVHGYSTDLVTDQALEWLEKHLGSSKPFLLFVQYKAPHVPRMPALRYLEKYKDDTITEPPTLHDDLSTRSYYAKQVNFFLDRWRPLPEYGTYDPDKRNIYLERMTDEQLKAYHAVRDPLNIEYKKMLERGDLQDSANMRSYVYQRFIKDYLRIVSGIDENVGRLLDYFDKNEKLKNNTIVVYTSDQGYFTGEHGYAEKRLMYEPALEMPLLMRWPGKITPGTKIEAMVQNIDFAPTFLDVADIEIPDEMQGKSFESALKGDKPVNWRENIYYHYYDHGRHKVGRHEGIRGKRYKLIHFYTDDVWEFYDLKEDPLEINNVYNKKGYKEEIKKLKQKLYQLRDRYEVPAETFEPPYEVQ